ncbi:TatD family hydrolase [Umezakia ovalisporum]|jgi:TatD DNase family protein|uniref:D-aminoacyl-tRNA deacylase n=2 Tax=Umezakia ovalisporum TaxID=75695 RepID=A0AA43GWY0_9CYAN|nr:TatD family hydrolase [Umezakia ovalisporum]MBI1242382.1 YchF/TatD family DNA exonuclease [Nostoc sp. RI_552]MDH6058792.1 TatD family hydrolase [Umezakia ovalisporum FSS-43]MDH6063246.1 TatD family hydrolase [Umezakia ovalisporum FSS-62]MDH6068323.1 TatD family hydrolase [Umezakia ovalisporum APH033B]MDH6069582.1 TatD family hydrolase [Umezakia ovalisporum CobakiLakeA]
MQLIDTHVHLNFDTFQPDLATVRSRWQQAGVVHLVHSCVEPSEFSTIQALAHQFPELSFAVGLHPLDADKWDRDTGAEIKALARSDPKVVAIGEMGMDLYKADNYAVQRMAFEAQLAIACELNLPVIIHCRDAATQVREVLQQWRESTKVIPRGVMHCWGGTPEETKWFLDLGFYISFSGTVTFKNAKTIQASAAIVSSDRLLVETDCPFLSPVPKRGEKRNEPAYVRYVAEQVAHLRGETLEAIAAQTTQNACELFRLAL